MKPIIAPDIKTITQGELNTLVVLDIDPRDLTRQQTEKVMKATWYEGKGFILVPAPEIDYLTETDPTDAGNASEEIEIAKIDDPLKRWSIEDGFYHA